MKGALRVIPAGLRARLPLATLVNIFCELHNRIVAIYHFSAKTVSRSDGRSSTAAAAYRSGERIVDERTGEIHDYTRKRGVVDGEVVLPGGGTMKRADLWNAVEQKHKRGDALVAREFELALPAEMNDEQRLTLVASYAREVADLYGVAVDYNLHAPSHGELNFHAHVMLTACYCDADGVLGKKAVELDPIHCARAKILNPMETQRERWQVLVNEALATAGINARIDHRTLEAQGIDRAPGVHLGPEASAIERRGEESAIGLRARRQADEFMARVQADAVIQAAREKSVVELEAELAALKLLIEKREIPNVRYFKHDADEVTDANGHEIGPKNGLRNLSQCRLATGFGAANRAGVLQVDARPGGRLPEQLRRESASAGSGGAGAGEHGPVGDAGEQPGAGDGTGLNRRDLKSQGDLMSTLSSVLSADQAEFRLEREHSELASRFQKFQKPRQVQEWQDEQDEAVNSLSGGQFMLPVARNLHDFRAEQAGRVVHYFDLAGQRAFTDNGRQIHVHTESDEALLAALQLAKQKWGTVHVGGRDDVFKERCVKLAAEHGIELKNPDLAVQVRALRAEAATQKAAWAEQQAIDRRAAVQVAVQSQSLIVKPVAKAEAPKTREQLESELAAIVVEMKQCALINETGQQRLKQAKPRADIAEAKADLKNVQARRNTAGKNLRALVTAKAGFWSFAKPGLDAKLAQARTDFAKADRSLKICTEFAGAPARETVEAVLATNRATEAALAARCRPIEAQIDVLEQQRRHVEAQRDVQQKADEAVREAVRLAQAEQQRRQAEAQEAQRQSQQVRTEYERPKG